MNILLTLAKYLCKKSFNDLEYALKGPKQTQQETLQRILSQTKYSQSEFKDLPLRKYENIHNIHDLTITSPKFFETTSGSSGNKKEIPYNNALINDFTEMFKAWCYDVLVFGPKFSSAKIYFSISPQFTQDKKIQTDQDYLAGITGLLFAHYSVLPKKIAKVDDPKAYLMIIALHLISHKKLEIISIWSPSLLLSILDTVLENHEEIIQHLKNREYNYQGIKFSLPNCDNFKLFELTKLNPNFSILFNRLKFISCWGALNSQADYLKLKKLFPNTLVQEKGLLATEAPISIPSIKHQCFIPLLNKVYFEFLDDNQNLLTIEQLKLDKTYEVVITQSSGLVRYRIGDLVKVSKIVYKTPCFTFVGRASSVSDLVGEKINEIFLRTELSNADIPPCIFIPSGSTKRYYCLAELSIGQDKLETILQKNPHYRNAILLQQLRPVEFIQVNGLKTKITNFFTQERGMKLGDIKDKVLYHQETDNLFLDYLLRD